jgi:hypothetical protein
MAVLHQSPWNGNIRELQNLIDFFQAVTTTGHIEISDLPDDYYDALQTHNTPIAHAEHYSPSEDALTQDDFVILKCILATNALGKGVGRDGIANSVNKDMPYLTSTRIRKRTDVLSTLGYLTKGAGRGGMRITKKGIDLLKV